MTCCALATAGTPELPGYDFTTPDGAAGWKADHDIARLERTAEGLLVEIAGNDPYFSGPPRDFPADVPLFLQLRLKSDQAGACQVFYFDKHPTEERSVRLQGKGGGWEDLETILPALGPRFRFRIDPPGTGGTVVFASLRFRARAVLKEPVWEKPVHPSPVGGAGLGERLAVKSGAFELRQLPSIWGGFTLHVGEKEVACGHTRLQIGYVHGGEQRWLDIAGQAKVEARKRGEGISVRATLADKDGGEWVLEQRFLPGEAVVGVETSITVSQDRDVVFLPLLVVLPGVNTFGEKKGQALFAGLEYLDDEPSSSEADIVGPASKRQVPDSLKITFPLMAVQADGCYVGLTWEKSETVSALFDSPDRIFRSGGHVMGVLFPGSNGQDRVEGSLLPHAPTKLAKDKQLVFRAALIGGPGQNIIPAVQRYVVLRGLPAIPKARPDLQGYVSLAAGGWLDSKCREGATYRHAVWPGFNAQKAADVAVFMDWLAGTTERPELAQRLKTAASEAVAQVPPAQYDSAAISHVRHPVVSLCYGSVEENARHAAERGRGILREFAADGSIQYKPRQGGTDYGKTHWAKEANGLTSQRVAALLEAASISGDPELVREGVRVLRALNKFDNTVPRGAQTWEVPLHTPDILASAHLVRAYVRGYALTGDKELLERARYWAWTGVPFVYLDPPTPQPVGAYATIAVLGATSWQAPIWFGLPVQWCGLVYADALYDLAQYEPAPWGQIADGITASGVQMTWPSQDKDQQGLLPDFYHLRAQVSDGPAINPGTVQANAVRLYKRTNLYGFHAFRQNGWYVHVPGAVAEPREGKGQCTFRVESWRQGPFYVLVSGVRGGAPTVRCDGQPLALLDKPAVAPRDGTPHRYTAESGLLVLKLERNAVLEITGAEPRP
jgi:hypothetical protein